jgi:magnesium-protoporphyrin IX monomethyl ester (oxidative) cyclase
VISEKLGQLRSKPGLAAKAERGLLSAQAGFTFLRLLAMPGRRAPLPAEIRLAPAY